MKLHIDTSNSEKIIVGTDEERFETEAKKEKSQKLLPFISDILEQRGKGIEDVRSIEINSGPGSFTGLRVGVSVANSIGWALGIPVNGKNIRKGEIIKINYE